MPELVLLLLDDATAVVVVSPEAMEVLSLTMNPSCIYVCVHRNILANKYLYIFYTTLSILSMSHLKSKEPLLLIS